MTDSSRRTPLFACHEMLGAKFVPFAGWEMPVQYSGLIEEHEAVRSAAGLFDVSHMGEIAVRGPEAERALNYLTCNDVSILRDGAAQYSAFPNQHGGIVDDIIIYRISAEEFLICVNASNAAKDFKWVVEQNTTEAIFEDVSDSFAQIALQGPRAISILSPLLDEDIAGLDSFSFRKCELLDHEVIIARTGYTGEDGVEIFVPLNGTSKHATDIWELLLEAGSPKGLLPVGLGARDTLRLEACFPLHGHELGEDISAIESGLGWIVKFQQGEFLGCEVLKEHKQNGAPRSLVGFFVEDRGISRHGDRVCLANGEDIGVVTSGTRTPTLERALGLALIDSRYAEVGGQLQLQVRNRELSARIVKRPFYRREK